MKKSAGFVVLFVLFLIAGVGCTNYQSSSMEEAKWVVEHEKDFKKHLQYFSVSSGNFMFGISLYLGDPYIYKSDPEIKLKSHSDRFIHVIIYETLSKRLKIAFLDDNRPPKIAFSKELD